MLTNEKNQNELRSNFKHFKKHISQVSKSTGEVHEDSSPSFLNDVDSAEFSANKLPKSEIEAVKQYINGLYDSVRTNKLTKKIELKIFNEVNELDDRTINGWLNHLWSYETYSFTDSRNGKEVLKQVNIDRNRLCTIIDNEDFSPSFDPITEYFERIKPLAESITSTPEMDKFIRCFTCDNPQEVVESYFKSWLAGVFINYYSENDKYDGILILQSGQGVGKTTAIEYNLLKPFRNYVVKNFQWNASNKDEMIKLATSLFIFDDELTALKNAERDDLKKITSFTHINNVRPPYGRTTQNYIRKASFIGATNNKAIVNDVTGTRRFHILGVNHIDLQELTKINYDLLWSEAYNYYHIQKNKVNLDFALIEANNQEFKFQTAEVEYLERYFDFEKEGNVYMQATEILDYLKEKIPHLQTDVKRLGTALKSKGKDAKNKRSKDGGSPRMRYHLHRKDACTQLNKIVNGDQNSVTEMDFEEMFSNKKNGTF
jgi:predicted P-loop ATPase